MKARSSAVIILGLLICGGATPVTAQNRITYTNTETGQGRVALGYPVPTPVASLTPVDGFRDYASLHARLQSLAADSAELSAHPIGRSHHDRDIWAYVVGSDSAFDREGRSKPAFFINATIHAREWAAPEVATGLIERMVGAADDGGLVRYLLDSTRVVVVPVHNVDGFLQTQRFPTNALIGEDPCSPTGWPRDGRMRRKNMRGADDVLTTLADHLAGVDLNRNHPPFWRTASSNAPCNGGSSPDPRNLVHHGSGPHSEAENRRLLEAARLGPESRIRLGVDMHTFSKVFYSSNTGRARLNAIQSDLLDVIRNHHAAVPTAARERNGVVYANVPDPSNRGIGAAAEYFAYQWLVPAWTLELEPSGSSREYGGFGVSHDGFILPASEIARVRAAWAESFLATFYYLAGAPNLQQLRVLDAASGALLLQRQWRYDPISRQRVLYESAPAVIAGGQQVRIELSFNKPMRHRVDGAVTQLPGQQVQLLPQVGISDESGTGIELDTSGGRWTGDDGLRYRDDTFAFEATMPEGLEPFRLAVQASDMVGLWLDADPSTPVDWAAGAWSGWDTDVGQSGDSGGVDAVTGASVAVVGQIDDITLAALPTVAGEGDLIRLRLTKATASDATVSIVAESPQQNDLRATVSPPPPPAPAVEWAAGETGERILAIALGEDAVVNGDRSETISLSRASSDGFELYTQFELELLDNDRDGRFVTRVHRPAWPAAQTPLIEPEGLPGDASIELVLDGDRTYAFGDASIDPQWRIDRVLTIHGNNARVQPSADAGAGCTDQSLIEVGSAGSLRLVDVRIEAEPQRDRCGIVNHGELRIERSALHNLQPGAGASIESDRALLLQRSQVVRYAGNHAQSTLRVSGGSATIEQSLVVAPDSAGADADAGGHGTAIEAVGGTIDVRHSTIAGDAPVDGDGSVQVTLRNSLVFDKHAGLVATPAAYARACSGPVLRSLGHNLFAPFSSAELLLKSGCLVDAADDRFIATDLPGLRASPPLAAAVEPDASSGVDASDCRGVDLHGRPRPQGSGGAGCEAGAVEIGINPYRGIWNAARDGHGIDIETVGNTLFVLWYTYDDNGEPAVYHAAAPLQGADWQAVLKQTRRDPATGTLGEQPVGTIGIAFASNTDATLRWHFDARGIDGEEALVAYLFADDEPRFEVTGHWYPPADSGYGVSVFRRGEVTAAVLYYYDAAGTMRWVLGNAAASDAVRLSMASYTGFCPDCSAEAMPVRSEPAGTVTLHFLTPERARVDTDIVYPGPAGGHWRRSDADFAPLSDHVDNRASVVDAAARQEPLQRRP